MATPPGFTSAVESKHRRAYNAIEPLTSLPPSVTQRAESDAKIDLLKAKVSLARVESEILGWYKDIREALTPEVVAKKAPMFLDDYTAARARLAAAQVAYDTVMASSRRTGPVGPAGLTESTVLQGVRTATGDPVMNRPRGGRSTQKRRPLRNGPSRVQRHRARRLSRRKIKA